MSSSGQHPQAGSAYSAGALALVLAAGAILTALGFEHLGQMPPCPLCLQQRYAYYAAIPALFVALVLVAADRPRPAALLFLAVALAFLANAGLGAYHAGVEWKWWPGPGTCEQIPGTLQPLGKALIEKLETARAVRCDEAAGRFLGLSFAGWNVIGSLAILAAAMQAALASARRPR